MELLKKAFGMGTENISHQISFVCMLFTLINLRTVSPIDSGTMFTIIHVYSIILIANSTIYSADPDRIPRSDLGLHGLLRDICPNMNGLFVSFRH